MSNGGSGDDLVFTRNGQIAFGPIPLIGHSTRIESSEPRYGTCQVTFLCTSSEYNAIITVCQTVMRSLQYEAVIRYPQLAAVYRDAIICEIGPSPLPNELIAIVMKFSFSEVHMTEDVPRLPPRLESLRMTNPDLIFRDTSIRPTRKLQLEPLSWLKCGF